MWENNYLAPLASSSWAHAVEVEGSSIFFQTAKYQRNIKFLRLSSIKNESLSEIMFMNFWCHSKLSNESGQSFCSLNYFLISFHVDNTSCCNFCCSNGDVVHMSKLTLVDWVRNLGIMSERIFQFSALVMLKIPWLQI